MSERSDRIWRQFDTWVPLSTGIAGVVLSIIELAIA